MSTSSGRRRLQVGLVGVGRLGRVYARDLATRIPETRLTAVADPNVAAAKEVAAELDVPRRTRRPKSSSPTRTSTRWSS